MKTSVSISKVVLFFVFALSCAVVSAENNDNNYKWVDNVECGKLMSREIMKQTPTGKYIPTHKYEYSYHEDGAISDKLIYSWDSRKNAWRIQSSTQINYDGVQVMMEVSKWTNPERKSPSVERMYFMKNQNDELVLNYVMEKKSNKWVLKSNIFLTNK